VDKKPVKEELTRILTSIFGINIKHTIEEYYEADKIDELFELANHMLSGYMGEANAHKIMERFIKYNIPISVKK
jgi:DNA primase large subunit